MALHVMTVVREAHLHPVNHVPERLLLKSVGSAFGPQMNQNLFFFQNERKTKYVYKHAAFLC